MIIRRLARSSCLFIIVAALGAAIGACSENQESSPAATSTSATSDGGSGGQGAERGAGGSGGASCPDPRIEEGPVALGFTPSKHVIGPLELYHHVPPSPRALVFTFHGTGGDAKLWFELTEARRLMAALVGAGYAIATLDSIAGHATGGKKQWDLSGPIEENADYQNVVSAITLLKNQKIVSDDIPIVLMGGSNGGAFASAVSTSIDAEALVLHISRGLEVAFKPPSTPPPTAWLVGRNDDVVEYETANLNISNIEAAGVAHVFLTNEPAPLAADSLTRIDGVSAQQSATFFMKVQAAELLDACGRQLSSPDVNQAWSAFLPAGDEALFEQIRHQLLELHAGHTITSDFNTELVAFLHEHVK